MTDIEIMNKVIWMNANQEKQSVCEDEVPARMTHETALHHVDGLL